MRKQDVLDEYQKIQRPTAGQTSTALIATSIQFQCTYNEYYYYT